MNIGVQGQLGKDNATVDVESNKGFDIISDFHLADSGHLFSPSPPFHLNQYKPIQMKILHFGFTNTVATRVR